jgi:hypothetical protein
MRAGRTKYSTRPKYGKGIREQHKHKGTTKQTDGSDSKTQKLFKHNRKTKQGHKDLGKMNFNEYDCDI